LVVGQPKALAAELLTQYAVLLAEVVDDVSLVSMDPASNSEDEEIQQRSIYPTTVTAVRYCEQWLRETTKNAANSAGSGRVEFWHTTGPDGNSRRFTLLNSIWGQGFTSSIYSAARRRKT
jgi:hypothetical protein